MSTRTPCAFICWCRFPHGKRGLKFIKDVDALVKICRFPHGKRGLKWIYTPLWPPRPPSLPPREAWIEIDILEQIELDKLVASPTGSVD